VSNGKPNLRDFEAMKLEKNIKKRREREGRGG